MNPPDASATPASLADFIVRAFDTGASDVFLIENETPRLRLHGDLASPADPTPVSRQDLAGFWLSCGVDPAGPTADADLSWQPPGGPRFRVNLYRSLGRLAAVLRPIRRHIPPPEDLGLPAHLLASWLSRRNGLILVTGPTGSGKSTTVASCLDWINRRAPRHIITLEDPIEFLFENHISLISQREIGRDSAGFAPALRAALRQSPDVLFLGEIRDADTAITALQAAETGHLVLSTLHSSSVVETIDRFLHLIAGRQTAALNLLASQLIGILSQQLLPKTHGGILPVLEYLQNEAATRRWILESNLPELHDHLRRAASSTCRAMLDSLLSATRQGLIAPETARSACPRPQDFDRALRGISG
jgi:pilus retraction protein PilT